MWDLGFPTDAIDVVCDLYTHATTKVKWGPDYTDAIPVDRGIQGDSSPFLFIYIEPLLRWLHVGGRAMHGCLAQKTMDGG
jgi:hypothetical protein